MEIQPTIQAATLSMWDTIILMIMALVVFGPRKLPEIGRQLGKLMYEFRKASNDFRFQLEEEMRNADEADRRQREEAQRQSALGAAPDAQIEATTTPAAEEAMESDAVGDYGEEVAGIDPEESEEPDSYDAAAFSHYREETEPERGSEHDAELVELGAEADPPESGAPAAMEQPAASIAASPAEAVAVPGHAHSGSEAAVSESASSGAETEPAAHHG